MRFSTGGARSRAYARSEKVLQAFEAFFALDLYQRFLIIRSGSVPAAGDRGGILRHVVPLNKF